MKKLELNINHKLEKQLVINNKDIEIGSKEIWEFALKLLDKAVEKGYLIK